MIAGLETITGGELHIGDKLVNALAPKQRGIAMVFQNFNLLARTSALENVELPLLYSRGVTARQRRKRAIEKLELVGLADRMHHHPTQLSGGQQQRVALARTIVIEPEVLLLDEPLSNLDAKLRHEVRVEIRELQKKLGLTTVMVTHDQEEALTMADRLVVMSNGRVQQVGSQRDLYENPANTFVAGFVGRTNFLRGRVEGGVFRSESGLGILCGQGAAAHGRTLAIRPERLSLATAPVDADNCFPGIVEFASYLGGVLEYYVRLTPHDRLMVQAPNRSADTAHAVGDRVHLHWPAQASLVLADDGGGTG